MSWFGKILTKTRDNFLGKIDNLFTRSKKIDDSFYDELWEVLITCDIGSDTTDKIVAAVKERVRKEKISSVDDVKKVFIEIIKELLNKNNEQDDFEFDKNSIVLVIGVNGVGKTTSVVKLANLLKTNNKSVLVAAADTFRAAAIEQLEISLEKIDVPIIKHEENSDPGAVVFDGIKSMKAHNIDVLLCDTAGRLHNKVNLMNELKKIFKIINKECSNAHVEVFIVLDATTGQNALQQVKFFNDVAKITGIILTKLDSTAKGGVVISICNEFNIPVRFIGVGEKASDLQKFNAESFAEGLFVSNINTKEDN